MSDEQINNLSRIVIFLRSGMIEIIFIKFLNTHTLVFLNKKKISFKSSKK